MAPGWVWHCRLVSLDLAPRCHRPVNRLMPGSALWAAVWPWASVNMPWLPHTENKMSTPHCRDTVMDGRGFTLPGLLKLSSSLLLGSLHRGQTSGRALARTALHVPPARQGRFGVGHTGHSASALQDDGCAFTGEACEAWCPRFSSEAASGWGPTGPFNTHVYLTRK